MVRSIQDGRDAGYNVNINGTIPYTSMAKGITDQRQAGTSGIRGTARVRMFGENS